MKIIPVLHIQQFEPDVPISDFYSNDLKTHLERNRDFFHKPHKHDFYLCVIFSKGSGVHEIDFNTYDINPGCVFFLKPGQTHYWTFNSNPEGYIFFHTQDFYELHFAKSKLEQFPFYYTNKNTPSLVLSSKDTRQISSRFKDLNNEYHNDLLYKKQKLSSLTNTIYIELARHYTDTGTAINNASATYTETLYAFEKMVETFYRKEKSAKFYASTLNITPKHLNRIINATLDKTTTDLIMERVILESKRLIVHSKNSLLQISEILGYRDYAYFSKIFKLKTGFTPLEFKKSYP
ncbi:helix-turn-helix domain-containing protein [Psychroserpens burtonensis]|uniref:Helix-turn-helix domain-containing protein n=1 Tax=Psychroserpens burtonensis TaxID=49278 RepID=A0A5C7BF84_9FLAO|nr:AraC family transcriptional regulator [Psychroserpens burtonensis]TXE19723.1 helix-turn-helix domain-containing protein [Psychroserpens burtonensis]